MKGLKTGLAKLTIRATAVVATLTAPATLDAQRLSLDTIPYSPVFDGACELLDSAVEPRTAPRAFTSDELYPIGFSPRGLFAFARKRSDTMQETAGIAVIDLVSDEQVEYLRIYGEELAEPVSEAEVAVRLGSHGISASTDIILEPFPLEVDGESYTALVEDLAPARAVGEQSYAVYLQSNRRGRKRIGTAPVSDLWGKARPRSVRGYFMSPHERRVVVVVSGPSFGGETGFDCRVRLFGAHLTAGFGP